MCPTAAWFALWAGMVRARPRMLKTIIGLLPATGGSITIGDRDITRARPEDRARLGIGYVPQGREVFAQLTVEENLLLGLSAGASKNGGRADRASPGCPRARDRQ